METTGTRFRRMCSNVTSINFLMSAITKISIICGLALLIVGTVCLVICSRYPMLMGTVYVEVSSLVIAAGVVIAFAVVLGQYGAKTQNFKAFVAYIVLLLTVIISNIVIIDRLFGPFLGEQAKWYPMKNLCQNEKIAWDRIQSELQCCGQYGPGDWGANIPLSCCLPFPAGATSSFECTPYKAHQQGCLYQIWQILHALNLALVITAIIVTSLQILFLPVAVWIAYRLKFSQETPYKILSDPVMSAGASNNSQYQAIPGQTVSEPGLNN